MPLIPLFVTSRSITNFAATENLHDGTITFTGTHVGGTPLRTFVYRNGVYTGVTNPTLPITTTPGQIAAGTATFYVTSHEFSDGSGWSVTSNTDSGTVETWATYTTETFTGSTGWMRSYGSDHDWTPRTIGVGIAADPAAPGRLTLGGGGNPGSGYMMQNNLTSTRVEVEFTLTQYAATSVGVLLTDTGDTGAAPSVYAQWDATTLTLIERNMGTLGTTVLGQVAIGTAPTATWKVKAYRDGAAVGMKAWNPSGGEPGWMVTGTIADVSVNYTTAKSRVGVYASGNYLNTVTIDNFIIKAATTTQARSITEGQVPYANTFEGGINGLAWTDANSVFSSGYSGYPLAMDRSAGPLAQEYSTTFAFRGLVSQKTTVSAAGNARSMAYAYPLHNAATAYFRGFVRRTTLTSRPSVIALGGTGYFLRWYDNNTLGIIDGSGILQGSASSAGYGMSAWARMEVKAAYAASVVTFTIRLFKSTNVNGVTPDDTLSFAPASGASWGSIEFGAISDGATDTVYWDDVAYNSAGWIGPVVTEDTVSRRAAPYSDTFSDGAATGINMNGRVANGFTWRTTQLGDINSLGTGSFAFNEGFQFYTDIFANNAVVRVRAKPQIASEGLWDVFFTSGTTSVSAGYSFGRWIAYHNSPGGGAVLLWDVAMPNSTTPDYHDVTVTLRGNVLSDNLGNRYDMTPLGYLGARDGIMFDEISGMDVDIIEITPITAEYARAIAEAAAASDGVSRVLTPAAGGGTFPRSVADAAVALDSTLTRSLAFSRAAADTAAAVDAVARTGGKLTQSRIIAETSGAADIATRTFTLSRAPPDSAPASDERTLRGSDDFNRTDNASLGANWVTATALSHRIASNRAENTSVSNHFNVWATPLGTTDHYVQATFQGIGVSGAWGLTARVSTTGAAVPDAAPFYLAFTGGTTWVIAKKDAIGLGTFTNIGSNGTAPVVGDVMRLEVAGTQQRLYRNNVLLLTTNDATITSGNRVGFRSNAALGSIYDDFSLGDLGVLRSVSLPRTIADSAAAVDTVARSSTLSRSGWDAARASGPETAKTALLVVSDPANMAVGERVIASYIRDVLGWTATLIDDATAAPGAGTYDLAIITDASVSAGIKYRDVANPVILMDAPLATTMNMAGNAAVLAEPITQFNVGATSDYVNLNGTTGTAVTVNGPSSSFRGFNASQHNTTTRKQWYRLTTDTTVSIVFGYETGVEMWPVASGNLAPARRAMVGFPDSTFPTLTSAGISIFGRVLRWSVGLADLPEDVATRGAPIPRTTSDSAPATDTAARTLSQARTISDSALATDQVRQTTFPRPVADSAPAVDTVAGTSTRSRTAADSAAATDAVTRQTSPSSRSVADSASAVDTAARLLTQARSATEPSLIFDNFNRADVTGTVMNWEARNGADSGTINQRIVTNRLGITNSFNPTHVLHQTTMASNNHSVQATIDNPGTFSLGVVARVGGVPAGGLVGMTGYALVSTTTQYLLRRFTGSTFTTIATVSQVRVVGDVLRLDVSGTTITGFVNNIQIAQVTDATYSTGTRAGLYFTQNSQFLDDFSAGPVTNLTLDATARVLSLSCTASDTAAASDTVGYSFTPGTTSQNTTAADSAPAVDTLSRSVVQSRAPPDASSATDAVARTSTRTRQVSDSGTASDAVTRVQSWTRTTADSAGATDTVARAYSQSTAIADYAPASSGDAAGPAEITDTFSSGTDWDASKWTKSVSASGTTSVSAGVGVLSFLNTSLSSARMLSTASLSSRDVELTAKFTTDTTTGSLLFATNTQGTFTGSGFPAAGYAVQFINGTSSLIGIGQSTIRGSINFSTAITPGIQYAFRFRAIAVTDFNAWLQLRWWDASTTEPSTWTAEGRVEMTGASNVPTNAHRQVVISARRVSSTGTFSIDDIVVAPFSYQSRQLALPRPIADNAPAADGTIRTRYVSIQPTAVSVDGGWEPINAATQVLAVNDHDDTDYIRTLFYPRTTRFKLQSTSSPAAGTRTLRMRVGNASIGDITYTLNLYEGGGNVLGAGSLRGTVATTRSVPGFVTVEAIVTDTITNYLDLYAEIRAEVP